MVVVTAPEAGSRPGRLTAVNVAPSTTDAAAAVISASTLGTTSARTCQAWRPSGSATCAPGIRPSPEPPPAVTVGHRVRRFHSVPGTSAYRPAPVTCPWSISTTDGMSTECPCTYSCAIACSSVSASDSLRLSVNSRFGSMSPASKQVAAIDMAATGLGANSRNVT